MEESFNEKTVEELESFIVEIDSKIKDFEDDISYSEEALDDPTTPSNEYPELRGDINFDKQQIEILEDKKSKILRVLNSKKTKSL